MSYRIEPTESGQDIVIDGWESGIADSPYASNLQTALGTILQSGVADIRNANVISVPGEASVNFKSQSIAQTPISAAAFTADTAGTFTYDGSVKPLKNGTRIALNTLSGGTASLQGISLAGNSASITQQYASTTTGVARVIASTNTLSGTSAIINIGFNSQPNNADTVSFTVNGSTFTVQFVTAIGAVAGNVLIGATLTATITNLSGLLKNPGTTSATQVALSPIPQAVLTYFTVPSQATIVRGTIATGSSGAGATSYSLAVTTAGSDRKLFASVWIGGTDTVTSVTYAGQAMTLVAKQTGNSSFNYLYYIDAPTLGTNNVTVNRSGSTATIEVSAVPYTGATTGLDGSNSTTGTSATATMNVTVTAANCWMITMGYYDNQTGNPTGTGSNTRLEGSFSVPLGDSNAVVTAGSRAVGYNSTNGSQIYALISASFAPAPGFVTVGLYTTAFYYVQNATTTTFTVTTAPPSASGVLTTIAPSVPATASGTFTTTNIALFTQIVPNPANTVYYGIDTNGTVWCYNLATTTNWVYLGNTATAASTPDFNTGLAIWNGFLLALYDGPSGYYSYTRPITDTTTFSILADSVASTDVLTLETGTTAGYGISAGTPMIYTQSTHGGLTINTMYYAGTITSNSFQLFTDAALSSLVNITVDSAGVSLSILQPGIGGFTAFQVLNATAANKALADAAPHRTFVDKSNTLYWCNGGQISSLILVPNKTFNPSDSTTYTYTSGVFTVASTDTFQCMEQLGSNLIIGGQTNVLYSWDRISKTYTVIFIPENNIKRIVVVNSNAYLFCGNRGRIYLTNGANAALFKKVPDHLSNTIEPIYTWGGAMYNKNQLYFSLSAFGSGESSETGISQFGGIWAIDTNTEALRLVNKLSYDTYGGYCAEMCGMIANTTSTSGVPIQNFGLVCGWEDSTETASPNYGSDVLPVNSSPTVSNVPYSNYETYVDSDMIPIGTYLNPTTDANVEYKLAVPMVAGEGIKLLYRTDLSQSFASITSPSRPTGEFTSADVGGGMSGVMQVNFQKAQWVQLRATMKSTASSPSYVRLKQLRLR